LLLISALFLICAVLAFFIKNIIYAFPIFWGAPFVVCPEVARRKMLELLDLKPGQVFYDLGSGNGEVLIEAFKKYRVRAIGIEINPLLAWLSRRKIKRMEFQDKIKIVRANFFNMNFSEADAIFLYLLPGTLLKLEDKFLSGLKPGAKIVSLSFSFSKIRPVLSVDQDNNYKIRLYRI